MSMSGICETCTDRVRESRKAKRAEVLSQYGELSALEYERALEDLAGERVGEMEAYTRSEGYEIGIEMGEFFVEYHSSCSVCGFEFHFRHTEEVKAPEVVE